MNTTLRSSLDSAEQTGLFSAGQSSSDSDESSRDQARKRKRPVNVTCEACKLRKVRCDRAQPSCSWCRKNDHTCEYKARKKPGLRAGYGKELEGRLDRLESIIAAQGKQLAAHLRTACIVPESGPSAVSIEHVGLRNFNPGSTESSIHSHDIDGVTAGALLDRQLPIFHSDDRPTPRLSSGSMNPVHIHNISNNPQYSTRAKSLRSPHPDATFQQPDSLRAEDIVSLPPYDLLYSLVDLYFAHVNCWLSLLDRKTTMDTLFGQSSPGDADKILLHAIVATSLRFSSDSRLTVESRRYYHTVAKQKVQLFGMENSSVRSLQALVILALDIIGTTNGPPAWNMLSLVSRSAVQLGLAVEATSSLIMPLYPSIATLQAAVLPEPTSCIEDEERRRLLWSIYLLDRYATVATAFEFALDDRDIDRRLPCRDHLFSSNASTATRFFARCDRVRSSDPIGDPHGHFAFHCELLRILGRIHRFLKRPVDIRSSLDVEAWQGSYRSLDSELNTWLVSLPSDFANILSLPTSNQRVDAPHCGWIMLHAAYNLTTIRLNSSAAYPTQSSEIFSSSYSAMQRCLTAVDSLKCLLRLVRNSGMLDKVGPPFAFAAWVAARVMLVHGSTMGHAVDPDIDDFVSLLADMGRFWHVAQRYSDILSRVLREYRASQHSTADERTTPSSVKILADMRRCAFDLDYLISRQPTRGFMSYHPNRTNADHPNELEYLHIFDIFNFPRCPVSQDGASALFTGSNADHTGSIADFGGAANALTIPDFTVPDPDADWLFEQV